MKLSTTYLNSSINLNIGRYSIFINFKNGMGLS